MKKVKGKIVVKKMSKKTAAMERSNLTDHQANLESILGHSNHVKAIKDHNTGKHDHLSAREKGAAFHSAMKIHKHYKKYGKDQ